MYAEDYRDVWIIKYKDDPDKDPNRTVDNEDIAQYDSDDNVYDQPTAAYREDLAKHKLCWTGNWWSDMWFYTKQEHNLLSICLSEKVHPLGRWERFFIEMFIFALASMWAASVTLYLISINVGTKDDIGFDNPVGLVAYYGYSILGGLVKTIANSILKMMATCSCFQQEGTRARVKYELAGYVCMAIWGIISLGLFGLGIWFVWKGSKETGESLWGGWLLSLFISYISGWIISFAIIFLMFIVFYHFCMKFDYKFKFDVTYQDYLNWYDEHGEDEQIGSSGQIYEMSPKINKPYSQVAQNETYHTDM
eukprot:97493_1